MTDQTRTAIIGIGQFRGDTRNYVQRARAGENFTVLRRGRPVAVLKAMRHGYGESVTRISLTVARTQPNFFDRVEAGEVIAIESRGELIAAVHPFQ